MLDINKGYGEDDVCEAEDEDETEIEAPISTLKMSMLKII